MNLLDKAIIFATEKHSGMTRKGTDTPYIVHPIEAVSIAAGITNDMEILAAAALHDVVEDTPVTVGEIETAFGKRVAALVSAVSEDKMRDVPPSESWKTRKAITIVLLQLAEYDEKIITLADKLSNIRTLCRDVRRFGDKSFEKFNEKDKKMHEWYYREIAKSIAALSDSDAYKEFCMLIDEVFA
ncbi:MAG: HD domain-containing protein [Defluviitaleaceae bacterium]|nr:HD domain-containing protein [Defluviitaleaceae bacterium]